MNKEDRKNIYRNHIASNYIPIFILDDMGFFDAPASTKYHGNYAGGLFDHSLAVTELKALY